MASELFHRAVKLAHSGRKDEARAIFKRELEINPQYEPAWMWYVDCQSNDEDRIRILQECLRSIPDSQSARRVLDMLLVRQNGETGSISASPVQDEIDAVMSLIDTHQQAQTDDLPPGSVSPFTISPDEVTEDDLALANESFFSKFDDLYGVADFNAEERVDPTQPLKLTSSSLMPDEEEINHIIEEPEKEVRSDFKDWQPSFSDDIVTKFRGSLDVKTQPRPASSPVPTRPRPTPEELTSRPLFPHLETVKESPELPISETFKEESPGHKDKEQKIIGFFTPKRILIILSVCVGITFILVLMVIILLLVI